MPSGNGFRGIDVKRPVLRGDVGLDPTGPVLQHKMGVLQRNRQVAVYGRCEGVDQFRPFRVVEPECRAALTAEIEFAGRGFARRVFVDEDTGLLYSTYLPAVYILSTQLS